MSVFMSVFLSRCMLNTTSRSKRKKTRGKLLRVLHKHEVEPVLFMLHNHPLGGHLGVDIVHNKVREIYYWPQMYDTIKDYIRSCDSCQRREKKRDPNQIYQTSALSFRIITRMKVIDLRQLLQCNHDLDKIISSVDLL
ncbi:hypothetical protein Glove_420g96 [Diversispora epigaea]|uniref:Integrase zinc-binding domain-containing protein n=1 Tax=Diversispora epigaea TaxID=1348612 RepID=A0A397H180_9GLOM|nr:hypothetical protein Glove_420g96 [Diversispora epigaea]